MFHSIHSHRSAHPRGLGHEKPVTLHLEDLRIQDVTIITGLVDAQLVTHHFDLGDMEEAYDVFGRAADTGALKVMLTP